MSASGNAAASFYDDVLADEALFVLPGGLVLDDRATILDSMSGPPWDDYTLSDEGVVPLGPDAAAIVYRADGRRGDDRYNAHCTSTYVRIDGQWRLRMHQQTR